METCASCLVTKNKVHVKVQKVEILLGLITFSLALDCSVYTVAVLMHQVTLRRSFFYREKKNSEEQDVPKCAMQLSKGDSCYYERLNAFWLASTRTHTQ